MPTKEELLAKMPEYLDMKKIQHDKGNRFKCLNPEHMDIHPSMSYNPENHKVHCFSCGKSYDIFDIVGFDYGLESYPDKYRKVCEIFEYPVHNTNFQYRTSTLNHSFLDSPGLKGFQFNEEENDEKVMRLFERAYACKDEAKAYLEGRGINATLVENYGIGFYRGYHLLEHTCDVVIFPVTGSKYMVRNTTCPEAPRYFKQGKPFPCWNLPAIAQACISGKPLFVTEGIIDALSYITAGGLAVALAGTGNIDSLIQNILEGQEKTKKKITLVAACDDDDSGKNANWHIELACREKTIKCYCFNLYGTYKDANEALVHDRERFISLVRDLQTEQGLNRLVYEHEESDGATFEDYQSAIDENDGTPIVSTDFPSLNDILHGGLRPGLYILGAQPSIGKTTLWVQMKDSFCRQGRHVIFFSLETSVNNLRAKSVSRLLYERIEGKFPLSYAKDSIGVSDKQQRASYSDGEKKLLLGAMDDCKHLSMKCKTYDGLDIDVEKIRETVDDFISRTGVKPIVMVDYLQILRTRDNIVDERLRVIEVIRILKDLSLKREIPVMVISSLNRTNYRNDLSFESFMASGSIEYQANVLLGLCYSNIEDNTYDLKEAKGSDTRHLNLVVLKNKDGIKDYVIPVDYLPAYNYFKEVPARQDNLSKKLLTKDKAAISDEKVLKI